MREAMQMALDALVENDNYLGSLDFSKEIAALRQALANEALDRMAENARELGLRYDMTCPDCEYHKNRAARWRAEAYKLIGHEIELPWVGLTDEEVENYYDWADFQVGCGRKTVFDMVKHIAQTLKEKNT